LLHITFKINNVLFHLFCIYRSPNDNIDIFVNFVIFVKTEICNVLNYFFINVGNNLEIEHINSDIVILNDKNQSNDSIFLRPISSEEISEYIED